MTFYKFLTAGRVAPFSRVEWSRDAWMQVADPVAHERGFHVCRVEDLPFWLNEELWTVELDGRIKSVGRLVVAQRARLLRQVEAWNEQSALEFAIACVGRIAQLAAHECGDSRPAALGADLIGPTAALSREELLAVGKAAKEGQQLAVREGRVIVARLFGYMIDAAGTIGVHPIASTAYISCRAADEAQMDSAGNGYAAERAWQARWLSDRLQLTR